MGLDLFELTLDIEYTFGGKIPEDHDRSRTVGGLYAFLLEHARRKAPIRCPTSRAFYPLRRSLVENLGVNRRDVHASARLRDLIPPEQRATAWLRACAALGVP